jgi:hypothetical protein
MCSTTGRVQGVCPRRSGRDGCVWMVTSAPRALSALTPAMRWPGAGRAAPRQAAAVYLNALEEAGVLTSERVGRERVFVNPALLDLLKEGQP